MADGVWYFLEWYKKPTLLAASLATDRMQRSRVILIPNEHSKQWVSLRVQPLIVIAVNSGSAKSGSCLDM